MKNESVHDFSMVATGSILSSASSKPNQSIVTMTSATANSDNNNKPMLCQTCGKRFQYPSGLSRHLRVHTGERPFACLICNKEFSQLSHLQKHERTHLDLSLSNRYSCPECAKVFELPSSLQRHMSTHTGKRPYKCNQCKKSFNFPNLLQRHLRTHAKRQQRKQERQQQRELQRQQEQQQQNLQTSTTPGIMAPVVSAPSGSTAHNNILLGLSPFFNLSQHITHNSSSSNHNSSNNNNNHNNSINNSNNLFHERQAVNMNASRVIASNVGAIPAPHQARSHHLGHHMQHLINTSTSDNNQNNNNNTSNGHGNSTPKKSVLDPVVPVDPASILVEKKAHQCNVCHKSFEYQSGLQRHFRVHTGEKPFACHVCGKGFSQATHVQKHLLSAHLPANNGATTFVVLNSEERTE